MKHHLYFFQQLRIYALFISILAVFYTFSQTLELPTITLTREEEIRFEHLPPFIETNDKTFLEIDKKKLFKVPLRKSSVNISNKHQNSLKTLYVETEPADQIKLLLSTQNFKFGFEKNDNDQSLTRVNVLFDFAKMRGAENKVLKNTLFYRYFEHSEANPSPHFLSNFIQWVFEPNKNVKFDVSYLKTEHIWHNSYVFSNLTMNVWKAKKTSVNLVLEPVYESKKLNQEENSTKVAVKLWAERDLSKNLLNTLNLKLGIDTQAEGKFFVSVTKSILENKWGDWSFIIINESLPAPKLYRDYTASFESKFFKLTTFKISLSNKTFYKFKPFEYRAALAIQTKDFFYSKDGTLISNDQFTPIFEGIIKYSPTFHITIEGNVRAKRKSPNTADSGVVGIFKARINEKRLTMSAELHKEWDTSLKRDAVFNLNASYKLSDKFELGFNGININDADYTFSKNFKLLKKYSVFLKVKF